MAVAFLDLVFAIIVSNAFVLVEIDGITFVVVVIILVVGRIVSS